MFDSLAINNFVCPSFETYFDYQSQSMSNKSKLKEMFKFLNFWHTLVYKIEVYIMCLSNIHRIF